jgi:hypothetical protein
MQDPEKIHPGSEPKIQGVKKHRIPDPQHWFSKTLSLVYSEDVTSERNYFALDTG